MGKKYLGIKKSDKKIIIALSPDYANVGDIAIFIAQKMILSKFYPDAKIIEIPMFDYFKWKPELLEIVNDNDIITLIGGGNMGSIYKGSELRRNDLIKTFPNNRIIGFPQTASYFYVQKWRLKTSLHLYENHPNLDFFFREKMSYNYMKKNYDGNVYMVPDAAMYLMNKLDFSKKIERDKILLCFRDDFENDSFENISNVMLDMIKTHYNVEVIDTSMDIDLKLEDRDKIFNEMMDTFRSAQCVITNRLHGMIFSLLTKTPCIALDNLTKKVSSTYNTWLKDIPYIYYSDDKEITCMDLYKKMREMTKMETDNYNYDFDSDFKPLFELLKKNKL